MALRSVRASFNLPFPIRYRNIIDSLLSRRAAIEHPGRPASVDDHPGVKLVGPLRLRRVAYLPKQRHGRLAALEQTPYRHRHSRGAWAGPCRRSRGMHPAHPPAGPPPVPAPSTAARRPKPYWQRNAEAGRGRQSPGVPPSAARSCARRGRAGLADTKVPSSGASCAPSPPGTGPTTRPDHAHRLPRPPCHLPIMSGACGVSPPNLKLPR